jgi:hypothetical protein
MENISSDVSDCLDLLIMEVKYVRGSEIVDLSFAHHDNQ